MFWSALKVFTRDLQLNTSSCIPIAVYMWNLLQPVMSYILALREM